MYLFQILNTFKFHKFFYILSRIFSNVNKYIGLYLQNCYGLRFMGIVYLVYLPCSAKNIEIFYWCFKLLFMVRHSTKDADSSIIYYKFTKFFAILCRDHFVCVPGTTLPCTIDQRWCNLIYFIQVSYTYHLKELLLFLPISCEAIVLYLIHSIYRTNIVLFSGLNVYQFFDLVAKILKTYEKFFWLQKIVQRSLNMTDLEFK